MNTPENSPSFNKLGKRAKFRLHISVRVHLVVCKRIPSLFQWSSDILWNKKAKVQKWHNWHLVTISDFCCSTCFWGWRRRRRRLRPTRASESRGRRTRSASRRSAGRCVPARESEEFQISATTYEIWPIIPHFAPEENMPEVAWTRPRCQRRPGGRAHAQRHATYGQLFCGTLFFGFNAIADKPYGQF